jgi:hypothetical protein
MAGRKLEFENVKYPLTQGDSRPSTPYAPAGDT